MTDCVVRRRAGDREAERLGRFRQGITASEVWVETYVGPVARMHVLLSRNHPSHPPILIPPAFLMAPLSLMVGMGRRVGEEWSPPQGQWQG